MFERTGASLMESAVSESVVSASVILKKMMLTRSKMGALLSKATIVFSNVGISGLSMMASIF